MISKNLLNLVPLVAMIMYCILLLILLGSRKTKINKHYSAYIISMIVWSLGSFMMRTNVAPSPIFWNKILCTGLIIMPIIFYHFTLVLTESYGKKNQLFWGYISAGIFLFFNFFTRLFISNVEIIQGNVEYKIGPIALIMATWSIVYLILALISIIERIKDGAIPFIRVKYIIIGLVLVILGGLINFDTRLGRYPIDILSNTINALLIAYSIYIHKFLEIKIIVKKGLTYSLYKISVTGIYIVTIISVQPFMSKVLGYDSFSATIVIAIILAFAFQPLKNGVQRSIDRFFYKEKMNQQLIMKEFSDIIQKEIRLEGLIENLVKAIDKGINPKNKICFLIDEDEEILSPVCIQEKSSLNDRKYKISNPIIQWLTFEKSVLRISDIENSPFFASLWSEEKEELLKDNIELLVPMKLRGKLIGFMMLGEKKSEYPYTSEESDFLHTILNNASVAIDNAQMYEKLKREAITDGLTMLYNHRYFHEYVSANTENGAMGTYSIAMIDVDLFKLYNDLYGHSSGDRALRKIASIIKKSAGDNTLVARYGGEEFAVLFNDINGKEAIDRIEEIRKTMENCMMSSEEVNEFLTISIGVASYPDDGEKYEAILEHADMALYQAKENGRNKCIQYSKSEYNGASNNELFKVENEIKDVYFSAIYALAATIDAKDHYTYGHSENVSKYAVMLGEAVGFNSERLDVLKNAGLLHDIGKIGISESILTKESALTDDEYEIMKKHVELSITIIKHVPHLIKVIPAIMSHHERYDGRGYPRRIRGESIPIEGRCLCIVDSFDAMTTDRSYRKALSCEEAINELRRNRGTQFDPYLTDVFIKLHEEGKIKVLS